MNNERFEHIVKEKLNKKTFEMKDAYWENAEALINKELGKGKSGGFFYLYSVIGLLAISAGIFAMVNFNTTNPVELAESQHVSTERAQEISNESADDTSTPDETQESNTLSQNNPHEISDVTQNNPLSTGDASQNESQEASIAKQIATNSTPTSEIDVENTISRNSKSNVSSATNLVVESVETKSAEPTIELAQASDETSTNNDIEALANNTEQSTIEINSNLKNDEASDDATSNLIETEFGANDNSKNNPPIENLTDNATQNEIPEASSIIPINKFETEQSEPSEVPVLPQESVNPVVPIALLANVDYMPVLDPFMPDGEISADLTETGDRLPNANGPYIQIIVFSGANYVTKSIVGSTTISSEYVTRREQEETPDIFINYGLEAELSLGKFTLRTGLNYQKYGESVNYSDKSTEWKDKYSDNWLVNTTLQEQITANGYWLDSITYVIDYDTTQIAFYDSVNTPFISDSLLIDATNPDLTKSNGSNSYTFIEIPFLIGYEIPLGRFNININGGIGIGMLQNTMASYIDTELQKVEQVESTVKFALSTQFRVALKYQITPHYSILLEPNFRTISLNPISDVSHRYISYGIHAGLIWSF